MIAQAQAAGGWLHFDLPDAELAYLPEFLAWDLQQSSFDGLRETLAWHQEQIIMFGRPTPVPRLVAWYGDSEARYRYSGVMHEPLPWTPGLADIRDQVQAVVGHRFNSVLANLYRSGADSMGWHRDSEDGLGPNPVIASVSLGGPRRFRLRHKRSRRTEGLELAPGSLLLMAGGMQHHWYHAVPKTRKAVNPRINLTFRSVGAPTACE